MLGILRKAGYRITADEREADILIVNTCGFIEPAKQESIDTLLSLARYKQEGKLKLLAATGCLTQRYEQAILQDMPEVDLVLGGSQYPVRIADGCDNRCAYCAIPLIRGGFRSRDMQSVLDEIRALAEQGVKEHVLVARDTSRFGMDTRGRSLLPELMVRAADIPGVEWLRVLYCYPDEVDDTLLEAMASRPNICRYLDLPLQNADPQLLRRMNRRGDIEQTRAFLKKAREMGFTLRTTFITGFPGETDEQFERLMDFVRDVRFDRLGAFCYSAEDDTPAAAMPHQVPEDVKQRRLDRLMTEQQAISLERNRLRVDSEERVLVESVGADGLGVARSAAEAPETDGVIRVGGVSEADIGCFITARITGADTYDLTGEKL